MKYLIIISILTSSLFSAQYAYDYERDTCEQYTLGASFYLFDDNNGCVLDYRVGDFYYDTRFYKTFQIETALTCINNTNTWNGLPVTFDTSSPLICGLNEVLDKTSCTCLISTADTNTTATNNTLGLTDNDFNLLMGLSGVLFGAMIFLILANFLAGF